NTVEIIDQLPALRHATDRGFTEIARLLLQSGATPLPAPPESKPPQPRYVTPVSATPQEPLSGWASALMTHYFDHGYIRRPHAPPAGSDENWEVRFLCKSKKTLEVIKTLLNEGKFRFAEPYRKFDYHMLSVPGREAVERFAAWWSIQCKRRSDTPRYPMQ